MRGRDPSEAVPHRSQPPIARTDSIASDNHPGLTPDLGIQILAAWHLDFPRQLNTNLSDAADKLDLGRPKMTAVQFARRTKSQQDPSHRIH